MNRRTPLHPTALIASLALVGLSVGGCAGQGGDDPTRPAMQQDDPPTDPGSLSAPSVEASGARPEASAVPTAPGETTALATFGTGCFWCTEAAYEQLDGVLDAVSGYMGGDVERPTYRQVCTKTTGHVEVVQVTYDPAVVAYGTLLDWFWRMHDPTSWDRQGADAGPQYRSVIFFHDAEQEREALAQKAALDEAGTLGAPIVTEVRAASTFWPAEEEHQDFYSLNPRYGYCRAVITPKLEKLGLETGE